MKIGESAFSPVRSEFGFRGKIVLIGEHSADDQHQSVLGTVPGVVLQANYLKYSSRR